MDGTLRLVKKLELIRILTVLLWKIDCQNTQFTYLSNITHKGSIKNLCSLLSRS